MTIPPLTFGDVLCYRPTGLLGWAIATKTFHNWSHVEAVWVPGVTSVASRDGKGVNLYPMRYAQLGRVLRPSPRFEGGRAIKYFETVRGQAYDTLGLLAFFRIGRGKGDKQYCSEFLTSFMRAGWPEDQEDIFHGEDSRIVPPYYFPCLASGLTVIWTDGKP